MANTKKVQTSNEKGFFIKLDADAHQQFKVACVNKGVKMKDAIEAMVLKFITMNS